MPVLIFVENASAELKFNQLRETKKIFQFILQKFSNKKSASQNKCH